jgi:hypothetical protein
VPGEAARAGPEAPNGAANIRSMHSHLHLRIPVGSQTSPVAATIAGGTTRPHAT